MFSLSWKQNLQRFEHFQLIANIVHGRLLKILEIKKGIKAQKTWHESPFLFQQNY